MANEEGVGYGKPPKSTRFKPGQSGNPRGRPKGARGLRNELKAELDEFVTITENGKSRRIRKRRLILKALAAKAAKGDVRAASQIVALVIQSEGFEDQRQEKRTVSDADRAAFEAIFGDSATDVFESDLGLAAEPSGE